MKEEKEEKNSFCKQGCVWVHKLYNISLTFKKGMGESISTVITKQEWNLNR